MIQVGIKTYVIMDGAYRFLRVSNIPEEVSEDTLPP